MPGTTTVLGLTTITQADTPNHTLHFSTGISDRAEAIFTGASAPAGNITLAFGTITASRGLRVTETLNSGGVTFTAVSVNVTNTASASDSLLLDLQTSSSSVFRVARNGTLWAGSGAIGFGSIATFTNPPDASVSTSGAGQTVNGFVSSYSLTKSGSGGSLRGHYASCSLTVNAGITADAATTLNLNGPNGTNNGTVTELVNLRVSTPILVGTPATNTYVIKHNESSANLDTGGTWNDASSEYNPDGSRRKWSRGLLRDRLDVLAALDRLEVHVYAHGEDDPDERAGVFAERAHAIHPALSDGKTMGSGGWALALAACQELRARLAALEARDAG